MESEQFYPIVIPNVALPDLVNPILMAMPFILMLLVLRNSSFF